jgi:serine/threonine protein phosphatase PrpC
MHPRRLSLGSAAAAAAASSSSSSSSAQQPAVKLLRPSPPEDDDAPPPHIKVVTAQGKREYQEDTFSHASAPDAHVFGVFDGHGGDACSTFCAQEIPSLIARHKHLGKSTRRALTEVFVDVDARFCGRNYTAGSTATVGVLQRVSPDTARLTVACVGDSQAVLLRRGQSQLEDLSSLHHGSEAEERDRIKQQGGRLEFDHFDKIWRGAFSGF